MVNETDDFDNLYQAHAPLIYRFMFWRTKDRALSEDLTSNVFEKAWRTRKNFKGGSAKAWLYSIAHTTLIDHWRKKKDLSADEMTISRVVSDSAEFGEALDQVGVATDLHRALSRLPKQMRDVVELRFIQGLSARETAKQLDMSEANVRVIQFRALKKLRTYLNER
jgi:RNA polymerase sigma-70 factor (ECF subfamily)